MKNIIIITIAFGFFFFLYRSCTQGYDAYAVFVHVKENAVYKAILSNSNANIIDHGRKLIKDVVQLDKKFDKGDGPDKGLVRWYICPGIDCEEGWQQSFKEESINMDELETRKIKEYRQYDPVTVEKDAQADIKQGTIKLFYFDVYEVPELLVIDEDQNNLPSHVYVSLGTGCTDSYYSDDNLTEYRTAMKKALLYGKKYNTVIAKHFNLKINQTSQTRLNPTQDFIEGNLPTWKGVKIELSDIQPLFGGRHIYIDDTGYVFVQSVRPQKKGLEQKNYTLILGKDEMEKIIKTFIEQDFLYLKDSTEKALPDHAHPTIILTNSLGKQHSVTNWDPPLAYGDKETDNRFHTVYRTILRLETKALETIQPINSNPYTL